MSSAEVSWDPSGRVVLPDYLRDRAGITDSALFVAFGDGFEIWDPRTALDQPQDEGLRDLAEYHLRKGAGK
jgi:MraZ protein